MQFEWYTNNRTNSYVNNSVLYIKPTLTADHFGDQFLHSGDLNIWGSTPGNLCTGNAFYGCERQGGGGGNIVNPIQVGTLHCTPLWPRLVRGVVRDL